MRFAAFADVHGNALALNAVLDDMHQLGLTEMVHLGDIFSGPLDAEGTWAVLKDRSIPTVRGNHDRYLIEQDPDAMGPSDKVAYDQLPSQALDWLKRLPRQMRLWDCVYACHATPKADDRYWMERVTADAVIRQASLCELEDELTDTTNGAEVLLCAHTHIPRVARLSSGCLLVNPGSVGCPAYSDTQPVPHVMQTGTPTASYAILDRIKGTWAVTFRTIGYDHRAAAEQARGHGREDWARGLETGWL